MFDSDALPQYVEGTMRRETDQHLGSEDDEESYEDQPQFFFQQAGPTVQKEDFQAKEVNWDSKLQDAFSKYGHLEPKERAKRVQLDLQFEEEQMHKDKVTCAICAFAIENNGEAETLGCHIEHVFHSYCLDIYERVQNYCPMCTVPMDRSNRPKKTMIITMAV